ncbi:MAG: hypothetical protein L3J58_09275 [Emcibacter sp.]|nr:hypothetical protein [Emcibacter sp.]
MIKLVGLIVCSGSLRTGRGLPNPERTPYIKREEIRNIITSRYHDVAMALGQA